MKTWKEAFQMELMDDATKTGGISYQGEGLDNFLMESGMMSEKKLILLHKLIFIKWNTRLGNFLVFFVLFYF